jgi:NCAIR mutase (PurE)-related protein
MNTDIKNILESVKNGTVSVEEALLKLKIKPFEDIGYAKVDMHNLDIRIIQSETHEDDGAVSALHAKIPFVDMKTKSIK